MGVSWLASSWRRLEWDILNKQKVTLPTAALTNVVGNKEEVQC